MKKLAIWGWWQGHNLGDNWIKKILGETFEDAVFIDTSVMNFEEYGFVICGGGGLFIRNAISPWDNYTQKVPYGMLGIGAEFKHSNCIALDLKNKAEFFYVRDQYSLDCMGIHDIKRSYDVTFYKPLNRVPVEQMNFSKLCFIWRDGKYLSDNFVDFNKYISYENNYEIYNSIINKHFDEIIEDTFYTKDDDVNNIISSDCGFVISGRFHGVVAAIQKGIPCIAIDICPKIRALMIDCGLERYCIKVNETHLLPTLIEEAKAEVNTIRKKQNDYVCKANATLIQHINNSKKIIADKL